MKAADHIKSPEAYIASLPAGRSEIVATLHREIMAAAPDLDAVIMHGMIGYGPRSYRTRSGCEGEWFTVGLASRKHYVSLYLRACDETGCLAAS